MPANNRPGGDLPAPLLGDHDIEAGSSSPSCGGGGVERAEEFENGPHMRSSRSSASLLDDLGSTLGYGRRTTSSPPQIPPPALVSASVSSRAKFLLCMCLIDMVAVCFLALASYNWSLDALLHQDVQKCSIRASLIDIACLSIARSASFVALMNLPTRLMVRGSAGAVAVCCVCFVWNAVKIHMDPAAQCSTTGRRQPLALAAMITAAALSALESAASIYSLRAARKEEALERILSHVSAYTSIGNSLDGRAASSSYFSGAAAGTDQSMAYEKATAARSNTQRLVDRARPHGWYLAGGCLALVIRLPFSLSLPHFVSETIGGLMDKDEATVRFNITCFIACGSIDAFLDFWCVFVFGYVQHRIIRALRVDLYRSLLGQEIAFFEEMSSGELTSRLTADTSEMANDLTWVFRFTIESLVRIGGIATYMFVRSWRLAAMACCIIPFIAFLNRLYGKWMSKNAQKVQSALAAANTVAQEALGSMRTVFSFANEEYELSRYRKCVDTHYKLNVRQTAISGIYYMVCSTFLVNCVVQASLLAYGSHLVFQGALNPQTLLAFMLYQGQLQEYVSHLLNSFTNLLKSAGAGAKVLDLLERKPRIRRSGLIKLASVEGRVTFDNVSFKYPSRDANAISDLSFEVQSGELVAFVGPSGGGKSTIFQLIEHMYEPTVGRVCLDGVNVADLDHRWLHRVVALVGQEPILFAGSIVSNILYSCCQSSGGYEDTAESMARAERAAATANAHDFISALPMGYKTGVGEKGVQLSGGQKQRIAIARVVVQDPRVMLLDEATSALDSESEGLVQAALERAMRGRTVLVIAHRLATVSNATRIYFVQDGQVVEEGTHKTLMSRKLPGVGEGLTYRSLVERQSRALADGTRIL